jgi:hypothetical protein
MLQLTETLTPPDSAQAILPYLEKGRAFWFMGDDPLGPFEVAVPLKSLRWNVSATDRLQLWGEDPVYKYFNLDRMPFSTFYLYVSPLFRLEAEWRLLSYSPTFFHLEAYRNLRWSGLLPK